MHLKGAATSGATPRAMPAPRTGPPPRWATRRRPSSSGLVGCRQRRGQVPEAGLPPRKRRETAASASRTSPFRIGPRTPSPEDRAASRPAQRRPIGSNHTGPERHGGATSGGRPRRPNDRKPRRSSLQALGDHTTRTTARRAPTRPWDESATPRAWRASGGSPRLSPRTGDVRSFPTPRGARHPSRPHQLRPCETRRRVAERRVSPRPRRRLLRAIRTSRRPAESRPRDGPPARPSRARSALAIPRTRRAR